MVFSVSRVVRVVCLLGCEPAFLRASWPMRLVTSYVCSLYQVHTSFNWQNLFGTCFRVVDFSTTHLQVRKIGFLNTLGTKSTYSYVDVDNASASPKNRICRCVVDHETCQELVRNLSGNSRQTCQVLYQATYEQDPSKQEKKSNPDKSATPICCRCTKLVRNLSGNSRLNLSSSVPSYIRWIFRHLSKKIHSRQISTETQNS